MSLLVLFPATEEFFLLSSKPDSSLGWPFKMFLRKGVVAGFMDSSRIRTTKSTKRAANCTIKWMIESYGAENINGPFVKAGIYVKPSGVPKNTKLTYDYPYH